MNPAEAQVLLSMAATVDNRKPDEDAANAWAVMLDGLRFEDCRLAVVEHFKASNDWLTPATVRAMVKRIRAKRLEVHPHVTPPADLTPIETIAWLKRTRRRIADGEVIDPDAARGELKPRHLPDLRQLMPKAEDGAGAPLSGPVSDSSAGVAPGATDDATGPQIGAEGFEEGL